MTAKPTSEFIPLNDPRICKDDHLRLPREIVKDVGQHTIVASAIYIAACDGECFVSYSKLAEVAGCSWRTVVRALAPDSPLVTKGWVKRLGRQPFSKHTHRVRRTVSVKLTAKAIKAFDGRYHALPRALLLFCKRPHLTWAECLVLAEVCSRENMVHAIEELGLGAGAEGREWASINELARSTGLSRSSVIRAREGLLVRKLVKPPQYDDEGDGSLLMALESSRGLYESQMAPTAVDMLRSTSKPRRAWSPALPKTAPKPKAPPQKTAPEVNVAGVSYTGCQVGIDGVSDCHRSECQVGIGPSVKLSQGKCQVGICNDQPLLPTTLTNPLGPTTLTKNNELHAAADGCSAASLSIPEKASQGTAGTTPKLKSSKDVDIDIERRRNEQMAQLAAITAAEPTA